MPAISSAGTLSSAEARAVLREACSRAGIDGTEAELIRLGENAIFRLAAENVIVRIGRGPEVLKDAEKEVAVASWLHRFAFPAAQPTAHVQPIVVEGRPVTFWRLIEDSGFKAPLEDLARALRELHRLPVPADLPLPSFNIFGRVAGRIASASILQADERQFLTQRLHQLQNDYMGLNFTLPAAAVHGDAHQSNLIRRPDGTAVLIDFERFAFGPPEADLAMTATEYLVGWHSDAEYKNFADTYGFDITSWDGFPVFRAINELTMTTWLMQNVSESDRVAREFRTRMASLHDDNAPRHWSPF
ncbi:MAG TPA: aminoglycoside phosphotransferase family protein [Streptosporangiaceae bacterium]|nr:aminoglycoside phosphotransferase family protein [Streptosporangiaceae bacterium]